jgi:O-antigen ligase
MSIPTTATISGVLAHGEERPPRQMRVIWLLLTINVLGFLPNDGMIVPVPKVVGQLVTMGALGVAFLLALMLNPRIKIRPNAYLVMLSLLALLAICSSVTLESGPGALLRCARLALFVTTLWLLCRWWRGNLDFVNFHLRTLGLVLLSVVLGFVKPGAAFSGPNGRLVGALWPIPAPQVAQYCAIIMGLSALLWLGGRMGGRTILAIVIPCMVLLLLTHTRTAMVGMVAALVVAGVTQVFVSGRARRFLTTSLIIGAVGAVTLSQLVLAWLQRGQDQAELLSLTGRQKVWDALLDHPRSLGETLFGVGLTDKSFGGLPIDSSWFAAYQELGIVGVCLIVLMLATLIGAAVLRPPSIERSCAIFLVVYCAIASYTEAGLDDASPYLLHLAVAASLLVVPVTRAGGGARSTSSTTPREAVNP